MRLFLVNESAFPSAEGQMVFSPQVFQALFEIERAPGIRSSDLARQLGLVPTTASSLIARLVRNGLVDKRPSETDGRAVAPAAFQGVEVVGNRGEAERLQIDRGRGHVGHALIVFGVLHDDLLNFP